MILFMISFNKILYKIHTMLKICTHSGRFHCDQVLACTFLRKFTEKFKDATVVRSRDPAVWQTSDIVVDVGGKYQFPKYLDHHQIEFQQNFPNYNVRMSSAGLVYLHFQQIIPNAIKRVMENEKDKISFEPIINEEIVKEIREKIYKELIIYVDANDNGVDKVNDKDVSALPTTLWNRIGKINPMWWEHAADENALFYKAMEVCEEQFYSEVRQMLLGSIQTKELVREAALRRHQVHPSGKIVVLKKYMPWQKSILKVQQQMNCAGQILYIVFPEANGQKWRIQAVPLKETSFELRLPLKAEWRGIKDMQKLKGVSQIEDIDFVHANGFIGGAVSKESAILMGIKSFE